MATTAADLAQAYSFETAALELGAVVVDGVCDTSARVRLPLSVLNRHGLVAGATGTDKTKTLQLMAEQMSTAGIPVFLADVKGDVSGMAAPGQSSERVLARAAETGTDWAPTGSRRSSSRSAGWARGCRSGRRSPRSGRCC